MTPGILARFGVKVTFPLEGHVDVTALNILQIKTGLLASFGETGWFGGLAPFFYPEGRRKNRVGPERRVFHFPL
jgi:hypothetical protein